MSDEINRPPIAFRDAAMVVDIMTKLAELGASRPDAMAGMGVVANLASAIAVLAREVEALKQSSRSP